MAILKRDDILQAPDIIKELVAVPEWGGEVYVKGLTGDELDKFQGSLVINPGKNQRLNLNNFNAKLAALSICDEDGKRIFTESDTQALAKKSSVALLRVTEVARRLSGLGDAEVAELTAELEKSPFDASPSVLP